jgi:hypothetical protein
MQKKNDEKAEKASDQWRIGIDAGHVVKDPQRRTSRHARGCPSSWPWSPPNQGCAPDYSIAQADAAGLWTECTKARSGRAANDDSGKIHCKARRRAGVANCFAVALQSRNCHLKCERAWRESLLRAEPEEEAALDPERSDRR